MAKVKAYKFHSDYCLEGEIRYDSGKAYAKTDDIKRCFDLNFCEEVTIDESELSKPNPSAAERRALEAAAVTAELVAVKVERHTANALIAQARAIVKEIADHERELAAADEADRPAIQSVIADATAALLVLFA